MQWEEGKQKKKKKNAIRRNQDTRGIWCTSLKFCHEISQMAMNWFEPLKLRFVCIKRKNLNVKRNFPMERISTSDMKKSQIFMRGKKNERKNELADGCNKIKISFRHSEQTGGNSFMVFVFWVNNSLKKKKENLSIDRVPNNLTSQILRAFSKTTTLYTRIIFRTQVGCVVRD